MQDVLLKRFTKLDSITLQLFKEACRAERNARALDLATQLQVLHLILPLTLTQTRTRTRTLNLTRTLTLNPNPTPNPDPNPNQVPKALSGAVKLANHHKMAPLAERVTKLLEAKFDQADEEVDVEAPPPRAAAAPRPKPAPAASAPAPAPPAAAPAAQEETAGADADDEGDAAANGAGEADTAENAPPQAASKPSNPFAKTSSGAPGKNVLELGSAPATGPTGIKRKAVAPAAGKAAKKVA